VEYAGQRLNTKAFYMKSKKSITINNKILIQSIFTTILLVLWNNIRFDKTDITSELL